MKFRIILFFALLQYASLAAQTSSPAKLDKYDVVVSFGSMCCGPASDDFLKDFVKKCTAQNKKDIIKGWMLDGCGREGEYKILFSLNAFEESKKNKFIDQLRFLIEEQNKKNKAVNGSSGSISVKTNLLLTDFDYCRGSLQLWNGIVNK